MISKLYINKEILNYWEHNEVETLIVAIEELAELQKELTKVLRGKANTKKILEELTDTIIMCQAIQHLLEIESISIQVESTLKQHRTIERILNNNL